jgi:hypothetical protein
LGSSTRSSSSLGDAADQVLDEGLVVQAGEEGVEGVESHRPVDQLVEGGLEDVLLRLWDGEGLAQQVLEHVDLDAEVAQ